ncbi:MAG: hypothetical protein Q7J98_14055 [Kiritimatiellia bacterium]|nr:hypothetical protein [Kiritimatiellia bacterium]
MKKTAVYFLGPLILIAGIFILNAQDDDIQSSAKSQPAPAQPNAVEESVEENSAVETAPIASNDVAIVVSNLPALSTPGSTTQALPERVAEASRDDESAPADQEAGASESSAVSAETNVTAAQTQVETKPEQPQIESPAGAEKEISKDGKTPGFEIDRGGVAGKISETVNKPAAGKDLMPEELAVQEEVRRQAREIEGLKKLDQAHQEMDRNEFENALKSFQKALNLIPVRPRTLRIRQKAMRSKTECELLAAKTAAQHPFAVKHDETALTPEELLAAQEEVRRQAKEVEGLKKLDQAYQEMDRNEFENAIQSFQDALGAMPVRPHTVETRQKAMRSEAECVYRLALKSYLEGNLKDARAGIRRALEFYPAHRASARLDERIRRDEARRAQLATQPVPLKKSPVYQDKQKKIKDELRRGREYMVLKEYDNAEGEFKNVLVDDKFSPEASANLKKIAEERYNLETDEFRRMKAEMLSQIRDTWTPPIKKVITGPRGETAETIITSQARRRLLDKLNNITIEKIDFRNANIVDVIGYLHQQSIVSDRDQTPGQKGVNIILNLRRPGEAAGTAAPAFTPPAEADIFAAEDAQPAGGTDAAANSLPAITLTLSHISLMQALKYITECSGLKYRIEENVVVIFPADIAYGELETRTYKIQPSMVETIMGGGSGAGGESDKLELGMGTGTTTERKDMKQFFINAGVPFPDGTTILYVPGQTLLIVKNTAESFEILERLLNRLNVPPVQVEIEARFVEIGQNDLEEIGLEWLLTDNWELAEKQSGLPPSMRERLQMNKNQVTKGLRNLDINNVLSPGGTMAGIASISSILTNPELTVVLHALQQKGGANLLSAPKVTTKSGASAEIKVVEELIYPTEYQQQAQSIGTTSAGNQSLVQIVVTPAAFETRDTGVILQVTPTVGPDGETIDLAMLPQVVELARWIDYGSDVPTGDSTRTQHITLLQPVFHSRAITTSISIWDGQTVVMGGLITEKQRTTEDKIPLLGDIPLLGYLFRSKTSQSVKNNLLIFVTANLVDPAGNKIKKETEAPITTTAVAVPATP